jgi:hypothetical protein
MTILSMASFCTHMDGKKCRQDQFIPVVGILGAPLVKENIASFRFLILDVLASPRTRNSSASERALQDHSTQAASEAVSQPG